MLKNAILDEKLGEHFAKILRNFRAGGDLLQLRILAPRLDALVLEDYPLEEADSLLLA